MTTFGERLAELRQREKLSQAQLAERASIDQSFLSRLERDERTASRATVLSLVNALRLGHDDAVDLFECAGYVAYWREPVTR